MGITTHKNVENRGMIFQSVVGKVCVKVPVVHVGKSTEKENFEEQYRLRRDRSCIG